MFPFTVPFTLVITYIQTRFVPVAVLRYKLGYTVLFSSAVVTEAEGVLIMSLTLTPSSTRI